MNAEIAQAWGEYTQHFPDELISYSDWADAMAFVAFVETAKVEDLRHCLSLMQVASSAELADRIERQFLGPCYSAKLGLEHIELSRALMKERFQCPRGAEIVDRGLAADWFVQSCFTSMAMLGPPAGHVPGAVAAVDSAEAWEDVLVKGLARAIQERPREVLGAAHKAKNLHVEAWVIQAWQGIERDLQVHIALHINSRVYDVGSRFARVLGNLRRGLPSTEALPSVEIFNNRRFVDAFGVARACSAELSSCPPDCVSQYVVEMLFYLADRLYITGNIELRGLSNVTSDVVGRLTASSARPPKPAAPAPHTSSDHAAPFQPRSPEEVSTTAPDCTGPRERVHNLLDVVIAHLQKFVQ
jgi:hypothetical protein